MTNDSMAVQPDGGSRPVPDPTALTTFGIDRAVDSLRAYLDGQFQVRDERLQGIDKATDIRLQDIHQIPARIDEKVQQLEKLFNERFSSIGLQFLERDVRSDQAARSSADALAAALQAAKELVGAQGEASAAAAVKSETSFTKQIDQIGTIIQTLEKALDARITELKERIDRGEGSTNGARNERVEQREIITEHRGANAGQWQAFAGIISALILAVALYAALHK